MSIYYVSHTIFVHTDKRFVKSINDNLKQLGWHNPDFRCSLVSTIDDSTDMFIPVQNGVNLNHLENTIHTITHQFSMDMVHTSRLCPSKVPEPSIEKIRSFLFSSYGWTKTDVLQIPSKWIKYGDVIVLETPSTSSTFNPNFNPIFNPDHVLCAFRQVYHDVRSILVHIGPVTGELRKPQIRLLTLDESPITVHIENGIKYKFDVQTIMFAPGNGTERMRFSRLKLTPGELVVDMFAGLGYFTLPLARYNLTGLGKIIAIEKNEISFGFLGENIKINDLEGKVVALCGDNRVVGEEYLGKADRVLMGYLPTTREFLPRAFQFANPKGCIIHYHHLCTKGGFKSEALSDFSMTLSQLNLSKTIILHNFVKVKSYAPKLYHCVADIEVIPKIL